MKYLIIYIWIISYVKELGKDIHMWNIVPLTGRTHWLKKKKWFPFVEKEGGE